jgi:hypothetical protein
MLSPESRVVRLAARRSLTGASLDALRDLLSRPLRWDLLVHRAGESGILPLLAHHVLREPRLRSAIPPRAIAALEEARLQTVGRNLLLFRALEEVLERFDARRIPVIPIKGAFLIPEVYGGFDLRTASDLDLLVHREDLEAIDAALGEIGYVSHRDVRRYLDPAADPTVTSAFYRRPGESRYFLDLRWHLVEIPACLALGLFPVDMERIWRESEEWSCEGRPARSLSARHHLLYLALHALKHSFHPLLFLTDLAEFWEWGVGSEKGGGPRISVDALRVEADAFGLSRPLDLALRLSREIVGASMPPALMAGIVPPRPSPWERIFLRSVLADRQAPGAAYLVYLDLLRGIGPKLSLLRRTFLAPPEAIFWADEVALSRMGLATRLHRAARGVRMALDVFRGIPRGGPRP